MSSTFQIYETELHGARYYVISPRESSVSSVIMNNWCLENFGYPGDTFSTNCDLYYMSGGKIFFRNHEDATLFLLRWA